MRQDLLSLVSSGEPKTAAKINPPNIDEQTIKAIEQYFSIQDRDVLLKYLRDTIASADKNVR